MNSAHGDSRALRNTTNKRVFVTGGTGFLGYRVVRALLEQGADVTVLIKPGSEDKLGVLRGRVQYVEGDAWNPASLRGRSRGHAARIPLLGLLFAAHRPMPVDTAARGIASLALSADSANNRVIHPRQLRRLGRAQERLQLPPSEVYAGDDGALASDDEPPFGWQPD